MKKIFNFIVITLLISGIANAALTVNNIPKVKTGSTTPVIQNSSLSDNGITVSTSESYTGAGTGLTGTAASLTSGTVTTNANLTGDVTSSGSNATTLKNTGTAGTYRSTTFDAQGRETSGTNPTTFSGYGISDSSANLRAALTDSTGTGVNVFATTPTLVTPVLGVATATSINKMAITAPATSSTLAVADGKTFTVNNTLTLAGTDSTTQTFPSTSATIARTDAANTFTGHQTIEGVTSTGATGTGLLVFGTSPTFTTPVLGTPSSGVATNLTGTASGLTAGNVTTNANLTGPITSSGNATSIASQTGTGTTFVTQSGNPNFLGNIGIGSASPGQKLDVQGTIRSIQMVTIGVGNNIFTTNVGIGSTNPGQSLDVQGTIRVVGDFIDTDIATASPGTLVCVKSNGGLGQCATLVGVVCSSCT